MKNNHFKEIKVGDLIKSSGFYFKREVDISEVFGDFGKGHRRLRVFNLKGLKCSNPICTLEGTRLILSTDTQGNEHWDLYTDSLVLMNVDHITSKANGGSNYITNLQPMCKFCNSLKGHKDISNEELSELLLIKLNKKNKVREIR